MHPLDMRHSPSQPLSPETVSLCLFNVTHELGEDPGAECPLRMQGLGWRLSIYTGLSSVSNWEENQAPNFPSFLPLMVDLLPWGWGVLRKTKGQPPLSDNMLSSGGAESILLT